MANLKDTNIEGQLNVTEDINIGEMSVKEEISNLNSNLNNLTPWKTCTATAITNCFYDNKYLAKYRYDDSCIEIIVEGTYYSNSTSVDRNNIMVKISGLEVPITKEAFSVIWNDTNKSFVRVKLLTDGTISIDSYGVEIPLNHWISFSGSYFIVMR